MSVPNSIRPGVQRDLHLQRNADARFFKGAPRAMTAAHFQNILAGFDQQHIGAAFDQPLRLLVEDIGQFVKGDVAQVGIVGTGQFAARADAARHIARNAGLGAKRIRDPARHWPPPG